MRGVAERVRIDQEGEQSVLRFVLVVADGDRVAVEMRGDEIRGVIGDGDRVSFAPSGDTQEGLQSPRELRNDSTNSLVRAHRKPAALGLGRSALGLVATTVVTVLLTIWLEDLFAPAQSMGIDIAPEPSALPYALITAGLVALAWTIARARSARVASWPAWPMYAGPLLGVAVALLVLD